MPMSYAGFAWVIDALLLHVNAFCLETSLVDRHVDQEGSAVSRDELLRRFAALLNTFPTPSATQLSWRPAPPWIDSSSPST